MTPDDELPAGWLTQFRRGVFSGAGLLLLAVSACVVPAFVAWLVPGADSSPASSTVKVGALLALSASHGGVLLDGERMTLAPLLVTGLLGWLVSGQARRSDSWSSVVGLTAGYGVAAGLLADWATLGSTRAPGWSSALAGMALVALVGGISRAGDRYRDRLSMRYRRILRAAGAVTIGYLGAGALAVAGSLIWHFGTATAIQHRLAPGLAGLPVALLGVAAAPNAALAGVGYLTGPGFQVGAHTQISVLATSHGRLPSFPMLAAIPTGGPVTWLGLLLAALVAAIIGRLNLLLLRSGAGWRQRLLDLAAAAVLAGGALAVLAALAGGGIGHGALQSIGAPWWAVGACTVLLVLLASSGWLAFELLRAHATGVAANGAGVARAATSTERDTPTPARTGSGAAARGVQLPAEAAPAPSATTRLRAVRSVSEPVARPVEPKADEPEARSRNAG